MVEEPTDTARFRNANPPRGRKFAPAPFAALVLRRRRVARPLAAFIPFSLLFPLAHTLELVYICLQVVIRLGRNPAFAVTKRGVNSMRTFTSRVVVLLAVLFLLPGWLLGSPLGRIAGSVQDASGAHMAGGTG